MVVNGLHKMRIQGDNCHMLFLKAGVGVIKFSIFRGVCAVLWSHDDEERDGDHAHEEGRAALRGDGLLHRRPAQQVRASWRILSRKLLKT